MAERFQSHLRNQRMAALGLFLVLVGGLVLAVFVEAAFARRGEPVLVSQVGGMGADDSSSHPSISADGRYVAFESDADNLSAGDNNSFQNIFVRDLEASTTTLASQAGSVGANGDSFNPSISADGRYVAFESVADNLSPDDNNTFVNVFVRDLQASTTTLVSYGIGGAGADGSSFDPAISADGRFVAFYSDADNLSADDLNSVVNVFVRDTGASTTTLVSYGIGGAGADGDSLDPSISADGRYVAFRSVADNLSADDLNGFRNVFVRDTGLSTTTLVSYGIGGVGADGNSLDPSISADGRYVAFQSDADNLSADDLNSVDNVFVRDTGASTTMLVSYGIGGAGGDGDSSSAAISADGRYVAFGSMADNLSADDNNSFPNIFVRDLEASTTTLASQAGGVGADGDSSNASISADGRYVAFDSAADNLSSVDINPFNNVFRQDLVGPPPGCSDLSQAVAHDSPTVVALPCADADGDSLTRSIVAGPAHGSLGPVDQAAGTVTYTPDPGYVGPDSFSFRAADQSGSSPAATASLSVVAAAPGGGGGSGDATRKLTIGYSGKRDKFRGALRSNESACESGKVKVFEKRKGKDPKVGADKTNADGRWSFKEKSAEGKFFATVPQNSLPSGTICPAAKSKAKKVD